MKKKLTLEEIQESVNAIPEINEPTDKTPLKFSKKDKKRKKRKHLRLYIILGILGVILVGLGWFGFSLYDSMKNIFTGNNAPNLFSLLTAKQLKGESSGRVNILLLGIGDEGHAGQYLSDTIMVLSYDVATKQVAMISVPRDLYVNIGNDCGDAKINYADSCGESVKKDQGPIYAEQTVSQVLDIPIHYYVRVDFTGFKDVVDAVGGVDINVTQDLYDPYYPDDDGLGNQPLYIKKGLQHMDGATALRYARSRETTSDFDRARRQQQVLVAIKTKVMSTSTLLNPTKIASLAAALGDNVTTDFDLSYVQRAIDLFNGVDTSTIKNLVFDTSANGLLVSDYSESAGDILIPRAGLYNYSELQAAAKNIFTSGSVITEGAKIAVFNGTSTAGLATSVANTLRSQSYNIINVASADSQDYLVTTIVDGTNGTKPNTIAALEKFFNVKSEKGTTASGDDIEITVGKDYKG
jgi:LCP family protein required for cell wall assembly